MVSGFAVVFPSGFSHWWIHVTGQSLWAEESNEKPWVKPSLSLIKVDGEVHILHKFWGWSCNQEEDLVDWKNFIRILAVRRMTMADRMRSLMALISFFDLFQHPANGKSSLLGLRLIKLQLMALSQDGFAPNMWQLISVWKVRTWSNTSQVSNKPWYLVFGSIVMQPREIGK